MKVDPLQLAAAQVVPAGDAWQVPALPATLHEAQVPQLAVEQHTPSTQLPLAQSAEAAQVAPSALFSQDLPEQVNLNCWFVPPFQVHWPTGDPSAT